MKTEDYLLQGAKLNSLSKKVIDNDIGLQQLINELYCAKPLLKKLLDPRPKLIITFYYSKQYDSIYTLTASINDSIAIGQLVFHDNKRIKKDDLILIYNLYKENFMSSLNISSQEYIKELHNTYLLLMKIFIFSLEMNIQKTAHLIISMNLNINNKFLFIDFSHIFNLRYRFGYNTNDEDILVSTVYGTGIKSFIYNLSKLKFPEVNQIRFLCGINNQDGVRGHIYNYIFDLINEQGGYSLKLESLDNFVSHFKGKNENIIIQILSHFHFNRLLLSDNSSILFNDIIDTLKHLYVKELLNSNTIVDGICCSNFSSFCQLYNFGIKQVYSSHIDLENDLIAFMLFELYTNHNAIQIDFKKKYIDGKSYLHEAWSNVTKCFYQIMYNGQQIEVL